VTRAELTEVALFTDQAHEVTRFYGLVLGRAVDSEWPRGATYASGLLTLLIHERGELLAGGPQN
jgi:catechol-2,3-dioxygenase